jgi:hypothetical protein
MRLRSAWLALATVGSAFAVPHAAHAGAALDDDKKAGTAPTSTDDVPDPNASVGEEPQYGIGIRLRQVYIPEKIIELFVTKAPGTVSNTGIGFELTRRKGTSELQIGVEVEHLQVPQGVWINKGDNVPQDEIDYQLNEGGFGWVTFEFNFINHAPINNWLSFRYGGGAGLGVLFGQVRHIDIQCSGSSTNSNTDPGCVPPEFGGQGTNTHGGAHVPYDLPPVFPVITGLIGLQFKPMDNLTINLEGGIRTLPFFGVSSSYFF